jgi:hypothetical protein
MGMQALKLSEVEFVPCQSQVLNNISNNSARDVSSMPGKGDQIIRPERIGIMAVTASSADLPAANFFEPPLKLAAVP